MRLALNFHPLLTTGRNRLLATLLAGLGVVSHAIGAEPAARADTPWKPGAQPEFIVPSGAGAALDTAARKLTELLARDGVTPAFVVSNRSGAHSIQALESLERRPAYGGALITLSSGYVTSLAQGALPPHLQRLTPVATLFREYAVVAVRHDSPIRDARDLIERLKVDPEAVSIGIATTLGNHIHIAIAQPLKQAGVDVKRLRIVPYKSSAESSTALVGGHLDVVSATTPNLLPHLASGRVRLLAIGAEQRLGGAFAQTPTWREQGIDYINDSFQGVAVASGVSAQQRDYLVSALRRVTSSAEWRQFVELNQWQPNFVVPDDTARELKHQVQQTRALLAELRLGLPNAPAVAQWPPNPAPKVALFPAGAPAVR